MHSSRSLSILILIILLGRIAFVLIQFSSYNFADHKTTEHQFFDDLSTTLTPYRNKVSGLFSNQQSSDQPGISSGVVGDNNTIENDNDKLPFSDEFTSSIDVSEHSDDGHGIISIDDVVDSIASINDHTYDEEIQSLVNLYEESNDQRAGAQLVSKYNQYYDYDKAYEIFTRLKDSTIYGMDTELIMSTVLNSKLIRSTDGIRTIENLISELRSENSLSQKDGQRYRSLLFLLRGDRQTALEYLPEYTDTDHSPLANYVQDLERKINYAKQGMDIPAYYSDGLIALGLFQYGYPNLAETMAVNILHDHPNYVLPKQILGYSNITLRNRKQAQSYFLDLIDQDPDNSAMYYFFIGISSYRMDDYKNSILYLDQIPLSERTSDVVRYKILSYNKLGDTKNLAQQLKGLLRYDNLTASDMVLARELLVYEPLLRGEEYALLLEDSKLLASYQATCNDQAIDANICALGDLADQALNKQYGDSNTQIKQLIDQFPRAYLYYVLGDYYYQQGNSKEAQKAFVTALSLSIDDTIKKRITTTIKQLF